MAGRLVQNDDRAKSEISNSPHALENGTSVCRGVSAARVQKEGDTGDDGVTNGRFRRHPPRSAHEMSENDRNIFFADGPETVLGECETVHRHGLRR